MLDALRLEDMRVISDLTLLCESMKQEKMLLWTSWVLNSQVK